MKGRPFIAVVDLETTGFAPPEAAPIEIGRADLVVGETWTDRPDWSAARVIAPVAALIDPGRAVPPESSAVHHLIDEDLAGAPSWERAVGHLKIGSPSCCFALAAHSARFEQQWLTSELTGDLPWICTYKCALRAWPDAPGHSNQALRYWLKPEGLDRAAATPAHRAGPDAYVTAFLLRELLQAHPLEELIQWSAEPAVLVRVPFGRRPEEGGWRGCRWTEVDDGFLYWTVSRDFSEDIIHTVRLEIERRAALAEAADDGFHDAEAEGGA